MKEVYEKPVFNVKELPGGPPTPAPAPPLCLVAATPLLPASLAAGLPKDARVYGAG